VRKEKVRGSIGNCDEETRSADEKAVMAELYGIELLESLFSFWSTLWNTIWLNSGVDVCFVAEKSALRISLFWSFMYVFL